MADQRLDVLGSLPQRRGVDREDVQALVEVITEPMLVHHLDEVPVRRGHQTDVDLDRPGTADAHELLLLQHAEELRL